jgi:HEAT repeat protein
VLLCGEPGAGKSSLVHAGLLPQLRSQVVAFTIANGNDLFEELPSSQAASALFIIDDLGAALDAGPRFARLLDLLRRAANQPNLKALFVIDDPDLARLHHVESEIGVAPASRLHLECFDAPRVTEILERTILSGGIYFEAGLSQQIALDLAQSGPVSPSKLQIVVGTAVANRVTTLHAWRKGGGADVLVWRFFERACAAAGGRTALRALAELAAREPYEIVSLEEVRRAVGGGLVEAKKIAAGLQEALLLRPEEGGYQLAAEWLRGPARAYTGEVRGRQIAARLLLRSRVESGGLVPVAQLPKVRQFVGTLLPEEERIVTRTMKAAALVLCVLTSLPLLAGFFLYQKNSHSFYWDLAGEGPGAAVVARLGRKNTLISGWPHQPAFGAVVEDTGFARAAIREELPEDPVATGSLEIKHFWSSLQPLLRPLPRALLSLIVDGDAKPLGQLYDDPSLRGAVLDILAVAGPGAPEELALLKRSFGDDSVEVRRRSVAAAAAYERRFPGRGAPLLLAALQDPAAAVRALAKSAIDSLPDLQALPLLSQMLSYADGALRRSALESIAKLASRTPQAAGSLSQALSGASRADVALLLDKWISGPGRGVSQGQPAITKAALEAVKAIALDSKASELARIEALRLLRGRPEMAKGLEGIAGSARVMGTAMPILIRLLPGDVATRKVNDAMKGSATLRAGAAGALGVLPKTRDTAQRLRKLMGDSSLEVRLEATRSVPVLGREALPLLLKAARGGGEAMERTAVETFASELHRLGGAGVVQALEQVARVPRVSIRRAAIQALGRVAAEKPAAGVAALGRLLRDKNPQVRSEAVVVLGEALENGGKDAIFALRAAARDLDANVRRSAVSALGRAKDALIPSAAKGLQSFARDPDPAVRRELAAVVGVLGSGTKEVNLLAILLGDQEASVRSTARHAAQQVGVSGAEIDKVLRSTLVGAPAPERVDIAVTAGRVGAPMTIRSALVDREADVRRVAAENGGVLGAGGLEMALEDRDVGVRIAAVRGLTSARAVELLARVARSPDVELRSAALAALGEVGGPLAKKTLESALDDSNESVRTAAVRGLGKLGSEATDLLLRATHDVARMVRLESCVILGRVWMARPLGDLEQALRNESNADLRYAAALALSQKSASADGQTGAAARRVLEQTAEASAPGARLAAHVGRAFIGRTEAMITFLHLLRDGS